MTPKELRIYWSLPYDEKIANAKKVYSQGWNCPNVKND